MIQQADYNYAFVSDSVTEENIKALEEKLTETSIVVKYEVR